MAAADHARYMHLSGKIGGYLATACRYDRLAAKEPDPTKMQQLQARADEYRQRAEDTRKKRGPRLGVKRFRSRYE